MTAPNRNIFWAKTFVDELARCGLEAVCIAPGSRSTPLVFACAENPKIKVYSHIDERSTAFFALGLALITDKPVAILCSSGTATANFHPAIIEARYANVPLLVLTADRQHELRDSGANQTIDQVKMFGNHVLWAYDVALPESNPPAVAVRNLLTLADRAYAKANGLEKGPVHINFPFRKPLEPTPISDDITDITLPLRPSDQPFTVITCGKLEPADNDIEQFARHISASPKGLIICGPKTESADSIFQLSEMTGYPIFADPLSNVRVNAQAISGYDSFLTGQAPFDSPDIVIHFGAMPASGNLEKYLNTIQPQFRYLITPNGKWTDAYHYLSHLIWADPGTVCEKVCAKLEIYQPDETWAARIYSVEARTWKIVTPLLDAELFDGSAISTVIANLPDETTVFVASSLSVRHVEQFTQPRRLHFESNRGASGIDGTISTAFGGAAANPDNPVVLITGDLAFYHDMNGLLAAKRCHLNNLTIVLINNDGGGIFNRLPIAQFDPLFTELFLTPHGLDFEPTIRMYGLDYHRAETLPQLREQLKNAVGNGKAAVIEVRTGSKRDYERRNEINRAVESHLQTL